MPNCTAVNGAGHQCAWPEGHKKHGFVGMSGPGSGSSPAVEVHGYYNQLGFWEVWPATIPAPAPPARPGA
jgi:hypothetical protein